ncbi:hypothetical protein EIP86_005003 [Pleurotus ostreatoroseus]|nr:hypothetical protein EIP86_005003 [Pleurotus ostreatoroseus]
MSSSSTTACSRSPSPATPDASDSLDPALTQEVVNAWCHSLSPESYVGSDSQYEAQDKDDTAASLELDDLIQDDAYDESVLHHCFCLPELIYVLSLFPTPLALPLLAPTCLLLSSIPTHTPFRTLSSQTPSPLFDALHCPLQSLWYRRRPKRVENPPRRRFPRLPIMFPSLPEGGTKSRVETQVRLTVDLAHASASSGEPGKYDRVGSWKWLRLPKGTSTKRRTRKEGKVDASPEDTLHLTTEITCASPPHTKVTCCTSCQAREAKRIERKLAARIRPARSDDESPDDVAIIPGRGKHEDTSKLIQFNCPEVLDFTGGTVILPLRITCYCRHHREKTGFNVHFTFFDHLGRVVGSGTTRPIMITDDHKSTGVNKSNATAADSTPEGDWPSFRSLGETSANGAKRKGRTDANGERTAKKRTKPYDGRRTGKLSRRPSNGSLASPLASGVPSAFTTTRPSTPALSHGGSSPTQLSSTVPTTPELSDHAAAEVVASILSTAYDTPAGGEQAIGSIFDDIVMPDAHGHGHAHGHVHGHTHGQQLVSSSSELPLGLSTFLTPELPSSLPLALQSPQALGLPSPLSQHAAAHAQGLDMDMDVQHIESLLCPDARSLFPLPLHHPDARPPASLSVPLPLPKIHRLIPATGPTYGGIEITVLGANFHPNMQLNCVFGDARATSTQRWSDNTLVCILPPSPAPGVVAVWFDGVQKEEDGAPPSLFAYTDETDRALMELALQVVGLKMTGKIEDARDVAMRIVNTTGPDNMGGSQPGSMHMGMQLASSASAPTPTLTHAATHTPAPAPTADMRHLLLARAGAGESGDFEQLMLDFLRVLDTPPFAAASAPAPAGAPHAISHATPSGQTLLHLAAFLGFAALAEFLVAHGADVDARDRNGCTPLHFAALRARAACARVLVDAGAALDVVDALGKTPAEVAPVGFFEDLFIADEDPWELSAEEGAGVDVERAWTTEEHEEEAAWGDVEEGEDEGEDEEDSSDGESLSSPLPVMRRRSVVQWKDRTVLSESSADEVALPLPKPIDTSAKKSKDEKEKDKEKDKEREAEKEKEAGAVDEKQVASLMEMVQRTLAQLQHPQGMIHNLPGMAAALSQMPAVFPVYVPIPALMTLFGERRDPAASTNEGEGSEGEKRVQQWLGIPTAQEWRAMLERWVVTARTNEEAPPAYTPRESAQGQEEKKGAEHAQGSSSAVATRRVGYEAVPVPEREVQSYGYRPAKKQMRKGKKHDRMLILFWIPILFIGLIWAFLHSVQVGFHAVKAVLTLKAGLLRT